MILRKNKKITIVSSLFAGAAAVSVSPVKADTEVREDITRGHIDVHVDHSYLDETVIKGIAKGLDINRDDTEVLSGVAEKTRENVAKTKEYYLAKQKEIIEAMDKYTLEKEKYDTKVREQEKAVAAANGDMSGLSANLSSNGQRVNSVTKEYSAEQVKLDKQAIENQVKIGNKYKALEKEVAEFNKKQNDMKLFETHAANKHIILKREKVYVNNEGDTNTYFNALKTKYAELAAKSFKENDDTVIEANKPIYTLYDVVIGDALTTQASRPVDVPHYTSPKIVEPIKPSISYKYYDLRFTPKTSSELKNVDDEIIEVQNTSGLKTIQAMKNQKIKMVTQHEKLPEGRFDKIHGILTTYTLPDGVEVNKDELKSNDFWNVDYNEKTRKVTYSATPRYLVEVNLKQNVNNGNISGTMADEFKYTVPPLTFKLLEDNKEYRVNYESIINNEYLNENRSILIKTTSADPEKHNKDKNMRIIDGKAVLPGTLNNYELTWDFDQYKGVNIDKELQSKGLSLYDFAPFDALEFKGPITIKDGDRVIATGKADGTFVDSQNKAISGLSWAKVDKVAGIERTGGAIKVSINGYDHPYYKEYVEKGKNLKVTLPMEAKKLVNPEGGYNGNTYSNVFYQDDFGNIYKSNEVTNDIPKIDPRKDAVISKADLTSLDLKANPKATVEHTTFFQYRTKGTTFPKNINFESYTVTDEFHQADDYDGVYFAETGTDIKFKQGTALYNRFKSTGGVMKANTDITKYTTQVIDRNISKTINTDTGKTAGVDTKMTKVTVNFDQDFIDSIDFDQTTFQVDTFFQAKRAKKVEGVTNTYKEIVNGVEFSSNEVKTNTSISAKEELDNKIADLLNKVNLDKKKQEERDNKQDERLDGNDKRMEQVVLSIRTLAKGTNDALTAIDKDLQDTKAKVTTVKSDLDEAKSTIEVHTEAIANLIKANAQIEAEKRTSSLVIFRPEITSDADAVKYAVNHGVAPASIVKTYVNNDGNFVVTYRNSFGEATETTKNINAIREIRDKYEFYALNTEDEVRAKLVSEGVKPENIKVERVDGVLTAIVYVEKKTEATNEAAKPEATSVNEEAKHDEHEGHEGHDHAGQESRIKNRTDEVDDIFNFSDWFKSFLV